jgi:MOSC domain-containing protein YiiM
VLKALATLRGKKHVEFGVYCAVVEPGTVRRGDAVVPR